MRPLRVTLKVLVCLTLVLMAAALYSPADVLVGNGGLLRNIHAYDMKGTAVVPLRAICEWMGAQVYYDAGTIRVASGDNRIILRIGESVAGVNGRQVEVGMPVMEFSGTACVPARFLASALGATVEYNAHDSVVEPSITFGYLGRRAHCILHEEPPDKVAAIIRDLDQSIEGTYGIDWVIQVTRLCYGGQYFSSTTPQSWATQDNPPYYPPLAKRLPGFWANAAGIYGLRDGKWKLLLGLQDYWPGLFTEHGIPLRAAIEMGFEMEEEGLETPPSLSPPPAPEAPPIVTNLTPANTRGWVRIADNYAVRSVTFKPYLFTWAKVLGELATPVFESTTKPIHVELSLIAYDSDDNILGFGTINLRDIPSEGAQVPFEVTMSDVRVSDIAYVRITPKGAWTYGK